MVEAAGIEPASKTACPTLLRPFPTFTPDVDAHPRVGAVHKVDNRPVFPGMSHDFPCCHRVFPDFNHRFCCQAAAVRPRPHLTVTDNFTPRHLVRRRERRNHDRHLCFYPFLRSWVLRVAVEEQQFLCRNLSPPAYVVVFLTVPPILGCATV